jgi:hypothetical protein
MEYFLELSDHKEEFIVHHDKLLEYGIMSSKQSNHVKEKLEALGLVEEEEFSLLPDIREQWKGARGIKHKKVYMLTPEAFKTCLMRSRKYPNQTVDPAIYSKYYLLLETIHNLYTDYEKEFLSQQLKEKDRLILRLYEMLIDSTKLSKYPNQVVNPNIYCDYYLSLEKFFLENDK